MGEKINDNDTDTGNCKGMIFKENKCHNLANLK